MRKRWLLLLGIVVSATCLFAKVIADYDHAVSFGKYHTYSWIGVNVQEPLWNDRVTKAIDNQLTAKGCAKSIRAATRRSRLSARLILSRRSTPFTAGGSVEAGVTGVGSAAVPGSPPLQSNARLSARFMSIYSIRSQRR